MTPGIRSHGDGNEEEDSQEEDCEEVDGETLHQEANHNEEVDGQEEDHCKAVSKEEDGGQEENDEESDRQAFHKEKDSNDKEEGGNPQEEVVELHRSTNGPAQVHSPCGGSFFGQTHRSDAGREGVDERPCHR